MERTRRATIYRSHVQLVNNVQSLRRFFGTAMPSLATFAIFCLRIFPVSAFATFILFFETEYRGLGIAANDRAFVLILSWTRKNIKSTMMIRVGIPARARVISGAPGSMHWDWHGSRIGMGALTVTGLLNIVSNGQAFVRWQQ